MKPYFNMQIRMKLRSDIKPNRFIFYDQNQALIKYLDLNEALFQYADQNEAFLI